MTGRRSRRITRALVRGCSTTRSRQVARSSCSMTFLSPEVKNLPPDKWQMKFRANRSLRDVEPDVNLWVRTLADEELEEEKI